MYDYIVDFMKDDFNKKKVKNLVKAGISAVIGLFFIANALDKWGLAKNFEGAAETVEALRDQEDLA